jgi:hypothetical protein
MTNAEMVEYFKQQAAQEKAVERDLTLILGQTRRLAEEAARLHLRVGRMLGLDDPDAPAKAPKTPVAASKAKRAGSVASAEEVASVRGVIALLPDGAIIKPKLIKEHCSFLGMKTIGAALRQIQQEDSAASANGAATS